MKQFFINGRRHRIIGADILTHVRGYEPSRERYNILQRRFLCWWIEVEREPVPAWAWIQSATLGSTDWQSPLFARLPQARTA